MESDSSLQDVEIQPISIKPLDRDGSSSPSDPVQASVSAQGDSNSSNLSQALSTHINQREEQNEEKDSTPLVKQQANADRVRFVCPQCEQFFRTKQSLNKHMNEHDIHCKVCDHTAESRNSLTVHYRQHHPESLSHTCQHCQGKFCFEDTLHYHLVNQHKETEAKYKATQHLADLRERPYLCTNTDCFQTFTTGRASKAHSKVCPQKPKCAATGDTDKEKTGKLIKGSSNPKGNPKKEPAPPTFSCLICGLRFKSHNVMFRHMYIAHDIGSDSGGDNDADSDSADEDEDEPVILVDSPSLPPLPPPLKSKPGPACSKIKKTSKQPSKGGLPSKNEASKENTVGSEATDLVSKLLKQDSETRRALQSVAGDRSTVTYEKMVADIVEENRETFNELYKGKDKQEEGVVDFDTMVATILTEHKEEIRKNVAKQEAQISRRLQQHRRGIPLNNSGSGMNSSSSSNTSSRSNSPALTSQTLKVVVAPRKTADPPVIGPASSALLGLLRQPTVAQGLRASTPALIMQTQTGDGLGAALQGASSFLMSALCGSVAQQAAAAKLETARRNIVSANNERASVYPAQPLKQKPSEAKDEDFRSTAKPVAGSVSTRPKRGKQRRNFSDLLHDESDDDSSDESNSDSEEYKSQPRVKRRSKAKMSALSEAEDSDCDSQWKHMRKRRKIAVYMRSCVLEWLDDKGRLKVKDKKVEEKTSNTRASNKKYDPKYKDKYLDPPAAVIFMSQTVQAQIEMVQKVLTQLEKAKLSGKEKKRSISDIVKETEKSCRRKSPDDTGLELVNNLFLKYNSECRESLKKSIEKHTEWKKRVKVNGVPEEIDAYDRSPAFRKVLGKKPSNKRRRDRKKRNENESSPVTQAVSPHKSIMGLMKQSSQSSPQRTIGTKSPITSSSGSNSSAWRTLQILNMRSFVPSQRSLIPPSSSASVGGLVPGFSAPQVYLNYNGQNLVRSANIGVVSANRKRKFDSGEVITIDSSEESDCDNNNAPPSRRKTPSPPPLQIADAFSLSGAPTGRNSPPDLDSSLEAIQGSLLDDFVTSSQKDPISRNSKRDMNKNSEKVVSPNKSRKTVPSCDLCGKSFDRSERYEAHMLSHQGLRAQNACSVCDKVYARRDALRNHIKYNHPEQFNQLYLSGTSH